MPMTESCTAFTNLVDGLVEFSGDDPELLKEIRWLDEQARQKHISFYDMVFEVLYRHDQSPEL